MFPAPMRGSLLPSVPLRSHFAAHVAKIFGEIRPVPSRCVDEIECLACFARANADPNDSGHRADALDLAELKGGD